MSVKPECANGINIVQTTSMMSVPQVEDYTLVERLGSGSYATVYKGFKKVCTQNVCL
jgi:hypothetical protein